MRVAGRRLPDSMQAAGAWGRLADLAQQDSGYLRAAGAAHAQLRAHTTNPRSELTRFFPQIRISRRMMAKQSFVSPANSVLLQVLKMI